MICQRQGAVVPQLLKCISQTAKLSFCVASRKEPRATSSQYGFRVIASKRSGFDPGRADQLLIGELNHTDGVRRSTLEEVEPRF